MRLVSYRGHDFSALGFSCGFPDNTTRGGWTQDASVQPRPGALPAIASLALSPTTFPVQISVDNGDLETGFNELLSYLEPTNPEPGELIAELNDGVTLVSRLAVATTPAAPPEDESIDYVEVTFTCEDPVWRAIETDDEDPANAPPDATTGVAFTVDGYATNSPIVTLEGDGVYPEETAKFRRRFSLSNNGDTPLNREPWRINLGDTSGWSAPNENLFVFLDGIQQPRTVVVPHGAINGPQSYLWILLTIAPGQTLDYEIVYGGYDLDGSGTEPLELTRSDRLAFDATWELAQNTSGSTASVINRSVATWETNQWQWGRLRFLNGPRAGEEAEIASSTATAITLATALTGAPDDGNTFLITRSSNTEWVYDVRRVERADPERGLWYLNRSQSRPSEVRFDTPGAWSPVRSLRNNDDVSQPRYKMINVGTVDPFAVPSIQRTWQNGKKMKEAGQADAVVFHAPRNITYWRLDWLFTNPNGVGKAFLGSRESGAEDWESVAESVAASSTPTTTGPTKYTLSGDQRHLLFALWPMDEEEIPTSWARDTGSWTGGGLSTLFDDSKSWIDDQWIGATIKITAGKGVGQAEEIDDNDANHVTLVGSWDINPNATSRYEIIQEPLVALLESGTVWVVGLDDDDIVQSAIGAEEEITRAEFTLTLDDGSTPYTQLRVGLDKRKLWIASTESLVLDGERRRAEVIVTATGAVVRDVTDWVVSQEVRADRTVAAQEWLPAAPGAHSLGVVNGERGGGVDVQISTRPGFWG